MPRFFNRLAIVSIALWLGSLAHTLLAVAALFRAFPKATSDVAVRAAPTIFYVTERANLVVGLLAIGATLAWTWSTRDKSLRWISGLLIAAMACGLVQIVFISARMNALRAAGEGGGELFKMLHGVSSTQYLIQTALLLIATLILPAACRSRSSRETA